MTQRFICPRCGSTRLTRFKCDGDPGFTHSTHERTEAEPWVPASLLTAAERERDEWKAAVGLNAAMLAAYDQQEGE